MVPVTTEAHIYIFILICFYIHVYKISNNSIQVVYGTHFKNNVCLLDFWVYAFPLKYFGCSSCLFSWVPNGHNDYTGKQPDLEN